MLTLETPFPAELGPPVLGQISPEIWIEFSRFSNEFVRYFGEILLELC